MKHRRRLLPHVRVDIRITRRGKATVRAEDVPCPRMRTCEPFAGFDGFADGVYVKGGG